MEHSGIYIGDGQIIHYNKHGIVERVSRDEFIEGTTAVSIYVGCVGTRPVGSPDAAKNAKALEQSQRTEDYNVVLNNCNQFCELCVTGKPSTATFLKFLKWTCESRMGVDSWRVWERRSGTGPRELDVTPTEANLHALELAIKQQEGVVDKAEELVRQKSSELSKHCSNQPTTIFFLESRIESWQRKYEKLDAEVSSRAQIATHEESLLRNLKQARKTMKAQLEDGDNMSNITARVTELRAMLEALE